MAAQSSYRKLIISLAILVSAGLLSGLGVSVAVAAPEPEPLTQVRLFWVEKGGVAIPPSESIEILAHETNRGDQPGVEIVLEVWVIPPRDGLHMFGFSLRWDEDGQNELEFVSSDRQFRESGDLTWDELALRDPIRSRPASEENPNERVFGELGSYVACYKGDAGDATTQCVPETSNTPATSPLKAARLTFRVNSTASPDTNDIRAIFKPNPGEWWVENEQGLPEDICPIGSCEAVYFGSAAVVPEPGGLGMQLAALTTLGGLLSARRRG